MAAPLDDLDLALNPPPLPCAEDSKRSIGRTIVTRDDVDTLDILRGQRRHLRLEKSLALVGGQQYRRLRHWLPRRGGRATLDQIARKLHLPRPAAGSRRIRPVADQDHGAQFPGRNMHGRQRRI